MSSGDTFRFIVMEVARFLGTTPLSVEASYTELDVAKLFKDIKAIEAYE